jgi:primosomal replication protein N
MYSVIHSLATAASRELDLLPLALVPEPGEEHRLQYALQHVQAPQSKGARRQCRGTLRAISQGREATVQGYTTSNQSGARGDSAGGTLRAISQGRGATVPGVRCEQSVRGAGRQCRGTLRAISQGRRATVQGVHYEQSVRGAGRLQGYTTSNQSGARGDCRGTLRAISQGHERCGPRARTEMNV